MAIAHRALLLHAFYPLQRTKSTLNSIAVGPLKRKKPAFRCRQNLPKTSKINPSLPFKYLSLFGVVFVVVDKFIQIYRSLQSFGCINQGRKVLVVYMGQLFTRSFWKGSMFGKRHHVNLYYECCKICYLQYHIKLTLYLFCSIIIVRGKNTDLHFPLETISLYM